jgi:hypothetical protein
MVKWGRRSGCQGGSANFHCSPSDHELESKYAEASEIERPEIWCDFNDRMTEGYLPTSGTVGI